MASHCKFIGRRERGSHAIEHHDGLKRFGLGRLRLQVAEDFATKRATRRLVTCRQRQDAKRGRVCTCAMKRPCGTREISRALTRLGIGGGHSRARWRARHPGHDHRPCCTVARHAGRAEEEPIRGAWQARRSREIKRCGRITQIRPIVCAGREDTPDRAAAFVWRMSQGEGGVATRIHGTFQGTTRHQFPPLAAELRIKPRCATEHTIHLRPAVPSRGSPRTSETHFRTRRLWRTKSRGQQRGRAPRPTGAHKRIRLCSQRISLEHGRDACDIHVAVALSRCSRSIVTARGNPQRQKDRDVRRNSFHAR